LIVFPFTIHVKHVPSLIHGLQFIGSVRLEKHTNAKGFLMIDNEGRIIEMSSGAISILHTTLKHIKRKRYMIY
jgi:hypothetical protein